MSELRSVAGGKAEGKREPPGPGGLGDVGLSGDTTVATKTRSNWEQSTSWSCVNKQLQAWAAGGSHAEASSRDKIARPFDRRTSIAVFIIIIIIVVVVVVVSLFSARPPLSL